MPVYQLGNGDEYFDSASVPDWTNDSSVIGGNGNDTIIARGSYPFSANHILVAGGNGNYNITLDASNSVAIGGNGNNTLTSIGGLGNTLEGGNGDNLLISDGGGSGMGPGNTLTGGTGNNTFQLSNDGNLIVTKGADAADVVTNGDVFVGPMDVITNYKPGDHIGLRSYGAPANEPAPTLVQDVPLAPDPLSNTGSNFRPVVGGDDYAAFRGTFAGINSFTVNSSGPDLFVVYDTRTGPNELVGNGSLVLLGVTDKQLLAEALSDATAPGAGWSAHSQANSGPSFDPNGAGQNSPAVPAVLDKPMSTPSAMDLIPT